MPKRLPGIPGTDPARKMEADLARGLLPGSLVEKATKTAPATLKAEARTALSPLRNAVRQSRLGKGLRLGAGLGGLLGLGLGGAELYRSATTPKAMSPQTKALAQSLLNRPGG